ncbi:MAG: cytochrome c biogenesis protein CcdA [Candidatus Woesebacteria bacterium]|nr:cytochrome c biogenesis protein CcdA [Candidatus Woesebacteria bacterium]
MDTNFLFGISLTASFLAGVLALFAPCCITFLFPSYLGTIFKENKRVMYYTLIFAVGLAFILVPIALGLRFAILFLDSYHQEIYYFGAFVMFFMGIMTLKPILHLPQIFHVTGIQGKKVNTLSVFGLGLMSGLTSACCAPVLFAAVTLTSLSPSLFQAFFVSIAYVIGIVVPLFIMSMFYEKAVSKIGGANRQKYYTILKYLGSSIFFITAIIITILNFQGKLQMEEAQGYGLKIRMIVFEVSKYFQNPLVDFLVFGVIIYIFYKLLKYKSHEKK